jgi:ATP-binding protein involved in chromosome partitioning
MKKIAIVSTKGGVGKTTATAQIALAFHRAGFKVGALDLDSSSPTLHLAFGLAEAPPWGLDTENSRILPSKLANGIELATMASFWGANNRVSWRGTDKGDLTRQMLSGMVGWSPGLDFLCIDSPPSMSEEIFVLAADKSITGYVIITQPQPMSIADIERLTNFCRAERLPVFGIVSNFDGCVLPNGNLYYPFLGGHIDVKQWAEAHQVPFLCQVPQVANPLDLEIVYTALAGRLATGTPVKLPNREGIKALKRGAIKILMEDENADIERTLDRAVNPGGTQNPG